MTEEQGRNMIEDFKKYISNESNTRKIPTNFNKLDNIYGGGLPKGLTIIGANTGLGKTTFVLQLADNIAQQPNTKVLFFSLELTRQELLAKSLSRISYLDNDLINHTPNDFLNNSVDDSNTYYNKYVPIGNNIYIFDNMRSINEISITIHKFCETYKDDKIVVIIDYLQFISCDERGNDKQTIDFNTQRLKTLANKFNIPIITISSLSREGAKRNDISSFKESGSIEYTADYLIMMYIKEKNKDDLAFDDTPNLITVEFLKNRFGPKGKFYLKYISNYATFEED